MTFKQHINYVVDKTNKVIRILYPLINKNSKLNIKNKLLLYKVALRPVFTYGCQILHDIARTHLKKLQVLQNKALKMILNMPWSTSTTFLHELANIETIQEFVNKMNNRYTIRDT